MNQTDYNREMLAFDDKIRLAKLEEGKAAVRVYELEYEKSRFALSIFEMNAQAQQPALAPAPQPETKPEG